ncbi:MAG: hypothetical protein ACYTEQ_22860 [Planctomycetota bacterium]
MKKVLRRIAGLFTVENIFLTLAIPTGIIVIVLDVFFPSQQGKYTSDAVLLLLVLMATSQLIERISVLPRIEQALRRLAIFLKEERELGLDGSYRSRRDMIEENILQTVVSGKQVDLLGVTHNEILPETAFSHFLQEVSQDARALRLLLLDPTSAEARRRKEAENEPAVISSICSRLESLESLLKVSPKELGNIVRLYDWAPSCMIIRSDDVMYVVHYVYGRFGGSPVQKLRAVPDGLFHIYLDHFERVWEKAKPFEGMDAIAVREAETGEPL